MSRGLSKKNVMATRQGFSLLELVIAMVASTVLLASLAATVVISTNLMETPPGNDEIWRDRMIADRLESDLRYATSFDENYAYGFQLTKPDSTGGSQELVTYTSYVEGLTRQVGTGPTMNLDAEAPGQQFFVDGYSAPTYIASETYARVRSSSTAATLATSASLDVEVPPGCKTGDLVLLCISAKTPDSLTVSQDGWQPLTALQAGNLRMSAMHRAYDDSWPSTLQISATPDSAIAVAMIAIQDIDPSSPIVWSRSDGGYALSHLSSSHPAPNESPDIADRQLNVQAFAADLDPWFDGAFGMAGFVDVAQATAADDHESLRNTIGIVVRSGAAPELSTPPRLYHAVSGFWLQTSLHVDATP